LEKLIVRGFFYICYMKNIHNLISDALEAAQVQESDYVITVERISPILCTVTLDHKHSTGIFIIAIEHDSNGLIRSVDALENNHFVIDGFRYTRILQTIYNGEYMYS